MAILAIPGRCYATDPRLESAFQGVIKTGYSWKGNLKGITYLSKGSIRGSWLRNLLINLPVVITTRGKLK